MTEAYDIVIEGGTVVDGTGAPAFPGAVAISGETLQILRGPAAASEELAVLRAGRRIDARGYVVAPDQFLQRLRALTKTHGMLLVVDEVQSGMGRSGKMFAIEHANVEPDVVAIAKGIASGLPLGVAVARSELMTWPPGAHASTFGGNPVACAAALATITLLKDQLVANAAAVGGRLMDGLKALAAKHPLIGDVRGRGLMIGVELVRDRQTKERATTERDAVVKAAFGKGLLVLGAGKNAIRFSPPLVLTREEAETAVRIFDEALTEVEITVGKNRGAR